MCSISAHAQTLNEYSDAKNTFKRVNIRTDRFVSVLYTNIREYFQHGSSLSGNYFDQVNINISVIIILIIVYYLNF